MDRFHAVLIDTKDQRVEAHLTEMNTQDLSCDGPAVLIKARYSSIGYKDALAITGRGKILRKYPLIAGQDVAGEVLESSDPQFHQGDAVIVTGCGLGETHNGGLSERVLVPADWVVKLPDNISLFQGIALSTAGFTSAQCIHTMEAMGQPKDKGPIVVTGPTGGVGSFAIDMLAKNGYEVMAITSRPQFKEYLQSIGAHHVTSFAELALGQRPLEKGLFGGAIDNLGGDALARLLAHTKFHGTVACVGLADKPDFQGSVMPFIIRGVSLLGINSTHCPKAQRLAIWNRIASDLKPQHFDKIVAATISLDQVHQYSHDLLDRKSFGRIVVDCQLH